MTLVWSYTQRDGKRRDTTVLPAVIIDAKRAGAKWHPDMRQQFGTQCSHGNMMQMRESPEWREAVISYARHHKIDEKALQLSMCKKARQARSTGARVAERLTPVKPEQPPQPKPGTYINDDGGRADWESSTDYIVMHGKIGDCGTRAMQITLRGTEHAQTYNTICQDIIAGKRRRYGKRNPWGFGPEWLNNNYGTPNSVMESLMKHYTRHPWRMVNVTHELGRTAKFKEVAEILADMEAVMIQSKNHIAACKNGVIYDSWDSRWQTTLYVTCREYDAPKVKGLLKAARK